MGIRFEHVDGGGYLTRADGALDAATVGAFRQAVLDERPADGFRFAVIDISEAEIPNLAAWPVDLSTVELLQPLGRLLTQPLNPDCRAAVVTTDPVLDTVLEDLVPLAGSSAVTTGAVNVARFDSVDTALAWCRSGSDD